MKKVVWLIMVLLLLSIYAPYTFATTDDMITTQGDPYTQNSGPTPPAEET